LENMKMKRTSTPVLASLAIAALLAACSSTPTTTATTPVETRTPVTAVAPKPATPATPSGTAQSSVQTVDLAAQNAAAAAASARAAAASAARIVYFDFDSYVIKDEFKPTIDVFARLLSTNKSQKLIVEGHADERGGREYNLALGQKRAEAVAKSLAVLGAGDAQVEAVSFGEERPVDTAKTEAAWAKNRRAELKDR
jgi:peptidoglycan-associated lipoprotein